MSRQCEVCGSTDYSGMRHAKRSVCFPCIDDVIEYYLANREESV